MWALVGLLLTIGGTFLEVSVPSAPWTWVQEGLRTQSLGITYQVGAVLAIGCLGGANAAALSQIAYVVLGLVGGQLGLQVFTQGGGFSYLVQPSFGYILGFIPGAWLCGFLAFRRSSNLEVLALSCLGGLLVIHLCGLAYAALLLALQWRLQVFPTALLHYTLYPLPGQLVVVCAVSVLALTVRRLMFS